MRVRTKICLLAAALLFAAFVFGTSSRGQQYLIGTPAADHWQRDDQYMGAALAPFAYCLAPAILLLLLGGYSCFRDRGTQPPKML